MPHALLLSPDDQAVSAITAVLEEMAVTCERPLDGVSAAQKINAQSFDLVLVDCENLPAAKLIFDVCRRGRNGNHPVPIAIVDGRAGLPTAFRLGAELILTKPVAKDQARTTIRTAVGRVRKEVPANESVPAPSENTAAPTPVMTMTESRAHAAAATASSQSSQLTSFADPAPSVIPNSVSISVPTSVPTAAASMLAASSGRASLTAAPAAKMRSAVDEIDAAALNPSASPIPENLKPKFPPSDDPVLAELERTELEESELAAAKPEESKPAESRKQEAGQTAPDQPSAKSEAQVFSSDQQSQRKNRGPVIALFVLFLACAGFYAAWTYQPGFQAIVQPQIDHLLNLAGMAPTPTPTQNPAKPSARPAPAATSTPAPGPSTDASKTASTAAGSTTADSAAASPVSLATASPTTPDTIPAQTAAAAVPPPTSGSAATNAATKPETSKSNDSKKNTSVAIPPDALPGESSAIILSSKGAEKRLEHSVPPKYPAEARAGGAEGTIVLKEVVDERGKVDGVRLVEGNAALATAAINAVKQWRYRPYVRDGKAEPFQTVVIIDFQRP